MRTENIFSIEVDKNMGKGDYIKPLLNIVMFDNKDVLRTSGGEWDSENNEMVGDDPFGIYEEKT